MKVGRDFEGRLVTAGLWGKDDEKEWGGSD